ncbi:hypothetical protein P7C71_g5994, partial [Lecanoromycetidae sp. Uapishka_2]
MSAITTPSTPRQDNNEENLLSPAPATSTITPPPSTQLARPSAKLAQDQCVSSREPSLLSPPATLKTGPPIRGGSLYGELPSLEAAWKMNIDELRALVTDLLPALGEARVTAAHSKLQHSLLSIETEEFSKRAEVEHEATRREVQVLQEGNPVNGHSFSPRSPQASIQRNLQLALAHCRDLQQEKSLLEKRLRSSKKIISQLDSENADLKEHMQLLRQRIKENRDHLNEMQSTGALSINGTPMAEHGTPLHSRTPRTPANTSRQIRDSHAVGSQDPIDNLLLAGHFLNGEASSVPSTPNQQRPRKINAQHLRGAHSLSSLQNTPNRSRPVTADNTTMTPDRGMLDNRASFSAPGTQLTYHEESRAREERDSTISASDNEEDSYQYEEIPGSQASQLATSMLRRSLGSQKDSNTLPSQPPDSSKLMQAKLFGQIKKPAIGVSESPRKRGANSAAYDESVRSSKKARISEPERVGLGIKTWAGTGQ